MHAAPAEDSGLAAGQLVGNWRRLAPREELRPRTWCSCDRPPWNTKVVSALACCRDRIASRNNVAPSANRRLRSSKTSTRDVFAESNRMRCLASRQLLAGGSQKPRRGLSTCISRELRPRTRCSHDRPPCLPNANVVSAPACCRATTAQLRETTLPVCEPTEMFLLRS